MNKEQYDEIIQKTVECSILITAVDLLRQLKIYDVKYAIDDLDDLLDTIGDELEWKEELGE